MIYIDIYRTRPATSLAKKGAVPQEAEEKVR